MGSDWDLIKGAFSKHFGDRFTVRVKAANPAERARVNAMNTRIKNGAGDIRFMVDIRKAPNVVKCFEGTPLLKGGSGEIDKKANRLITHWSDAVGYYIDHEFPIAGQQFIVRPLRH